MYYGLAREPEDQLPGLISAYVQAGGRRHRIGTGSGEAACTGKRRQSGGSSRSGTSFWEGGTGEDNRKTTALRRRHGQGVRPTGHRERLKRCRREWKREAEVDSVGSGKPMLTSNKRAVPVSLRVEVSQCLVSGRSYGLGLPAARYP